MTDARPSVLFVCVHNAGRSQMAAGWLDALAAGRVEVRSAGSAPKDAINPVAVEAMREVGIDISAGEPKVLTTETVRASDAVITMGCGDACPIFPGKRYEDWPLDDPAGQGLEAVRPIRDAIRARVEELLRSLGVEPAPDATDRRGLPGLAHPERHLERRVAHLAAKWDGTFEPELVERVVAESYTTLRRTARITTYLPDRAARFADDRLRALAQAKGAVPSTAPELLFVCVHNAGRSQLAAALATALSRGTVGVRSAGSLPADEINDSVRASAAEIGLSLDQEFPKPLTDDVLRAADVVVTMGCGDACTVYPGKRYEDWPVDDPAGQTLDAVRPIREDLEQRVRDLLRSVGVEPAATIAD